MSKISSPLRLLFLSTSMGMGGADRQVLNLALRLRELGHTVRIVSLVPLGPMGEEGRRFGLDVDTLNMRRGVPDPRALVRLVGILRCWRPVVLTTFMYHANLLGRVAGRLAGVPIVVSSVRNENFGGPVRDRVMRLTDWLADVTTTNSRLVGEAVVRRGVVPAGKLRVIPNGLDTSRFVWTPKLRSQQREVLGVEDDSFLWLAVGRLEKQKDYSSLLAAFARVSQKYPKAVLYISGQGPLQQTLEEEVRRLVLDDRVRFLGVRTDIPNLLAAADAFVLASAWEGLPNVVMEAMAAAKPVVATRVGGVPELVEEGKSGFLVPHKDPDALSRAMMRLMSLSPEVLCAMGQVGRAHVETHYALDRVVDQWEELFRELLQRKGVKL